MHYPNLAAFLADAPKQYRRGPLALVMVEDTVEVESTFAHLQRFGFANLVAFCGPDIVLPEEVANLTRVDFDTAAKDALQSVLNGAIAACPGTWIYYCYNAEYFFYPFSETRNIIEMIAFHSEERRAAMLAYVIDLYADDLGDHPTAVSLDCAHMDRSGYYALARPDPENHNHPKERQLDFFGGLRWRYEEHVPATRRKIDRIPLFKAKRGLRLRWDHSI